MADGAAQHSILRSVNTASNIAIAGTGIGALNPVHAVLNPAHLGIVHKRSIDLTCKNYYWVDGLFYMSAAGQLPINKNSGIGVILAYDGSSDYNEMCASVQYGRKLGKTTSVGLQFDLLHRNAIDVKPLTTLAFEVGIQSVLFSSLAIALVAKNPIPISEKQSAIFPSLFKMGICYGPSDKWELFLELSKSIADRSNILFGLEYRPVHAIRLRTGVDASVGQWTLGLGYQLNGIRFDASAVHHLNLGFSPAMGIQTAF